MAIIKIAGPIKEEQLKPIEGELQQPCTFYLYTGDATFKYVLEGPKEE